MLPEFGPNIGQLPRRLTLVRELEAFEGSILSQYRAADGGGMYLEKWCACDGDVARSLVVRTEPRALAEYLSGRMSMLDLLSIPSDGVGFVVDRRDDVVVAVFVAALSELPERYLPDAAARHDESLRPSWETAPQNFLLREDWTARMLSEIERRYLNVAGFAYFTEPRTGRHLPPSVFKYNYDGGYPVVGAFSQMRARMPVEKRPKSVGVFANSPGVLTLDAPQSIASQIAAALAALPGSKKAYEEVIKWARGKPETALERMPDLEVARRDLFTLAGRLFVDEGALLAADQREDPVAVLSASKLVASYRRQLVKLRNGADGGEFISVLIEPEQDDDQEVVDGFDDEDDVGG